MKARVPVLAVCAVFIAALCWTGTGNGNGNGTAFAHHRDWHGSGYKEKKKHKRKHRRGGKKSRRHHGGPPPWAPAHGYRAKHGYRHAGRYYEVTQEELVQVPERGIGSCNRDILGALLGGAVGAAAGAQIGSGSGKTAATIAGTIIGALVGGNIGRTMDQVDQNCIGQVLEQAPTGKAVAWRNPDQGSQYQVTPTRTYQTSTGQHCREYQTTIVIAGRTENAYGAACRQPDGSWQKTR